MKDIYTAAKLLYEQAFPGEDAAFCEALFALGFPDHFVAASEQGELCSMLFALPYPIMTKEGPKAARYLYAVATDEKHRGKGYAKELLRRAASGGTPVFLRPMTPSLFDFYKSAGFTPFSPYREWEGQAIQGTCEGFANLTPDAYLAARDGFLKAPYCRMTPDFLSLCFSVGGAVGLAGKFVALYERDGNTVLFKEWWGETDFAPRVAAFLGATRFKARTADPKGTPFGVGVGIPPDTVFLAALD